MHFESFTSSNMGKFLWPYSSSFSLELVSVLDTESLADLAYIRMFINLTITQAMIFEGWKKFQHLGIICYSHSPSPFQIGFVTYPSALKQYVLSVMRVLVRVLFVWYFL